MLSEPVILAIIAVSSPIVVGVLKELLGARKTSSESNSTSLALAEKQTQFLYEQLDTFRSNHEAQMDNWRDRYEKLQEKFNAEREKVIRLETRHEFRKSIHRGKVVKNAEWEIDYLTEFHSDTDAVVFANEDGIIVDISDRALEMFGYSSLEISGKPLTALMPERYHATHISQMHNISKEEVSSEILGRIVPVECLTSNGEPFEAELTVRTFKVRNITYFAGVFRRVDE